MKWAVAAAALVIVTNGVVLVSEQRQRSAPATTVSIDVCSMNLVGGGSSDEPPAIRLLLATDSASTIPGLDSAGLKALGFSEASVRAAGRLRDSTFHWPRARPAWVRIGQTNDSLASFTALEVSPRPEALVRDSTSLILRGLIAFREEPVAMPASAPQDGAAHDHAAKPGLRASGIIRPVVSEVLPALLHLDREQIARLRTVVPDSGGCAATQRAQIANGATGSLRVVGIQ
jgi:hypothetical protein